LGCNLRKEGVNDKKTSRYGLLDGIRGVAALIVVIYHTHGAGADIGIWSPRFGFLAVDLFFVLSGFVLSESYGSKLATGMSSRKFIALRLLRLIPLFYLGLALGCIGVYFDPSIASVKAELVGSLSNLLMLPSFVTNANDVLFPLNLPFWSLFFEFWVASIFFGIFGGRLTTQVVAILTALAAAFLISLQRSYHELNVGPSWWRFTGGFARVMYSFLAGVLISKIGPARLNLPRVPAWTIYVTVIVLMCAPLEGQVSHLFELGCVLIGFPILLALAAAQGERNGRFDWVAAEASYPIYAIHYPLLIISAGTLNVFGVQPSWLYTAVFLIVITPVAIFLNMGDERLRSRLRKNAMFRIISGDASIRQASPLPTE